MCTHLVFIPDIANDLQKPGHADNKWNKLTSGLERVNIGDIVPFKHKLDCENGVD